MNELLISSEQESLFGLDEGVFDVMAESLSDCGCVILPSALPPLLLDDLFHHRLQMEADLYQQAGIGRGDDHVHNTFVRTDEICWIDGSSKPGRQWLQWCEALRKHLNKRLFLGLFSFESHFAHYAPGDYYKRHRDAFVGESNRILSVVVYLNPGWQTEDGGEWVLYQDDHDTVGVRVMPQYGSLVVFLSEQFPHEVLKANRDRHSIAGWFRLNTSNTDRVDPPL